MTLTTAPSLAAATHDVAVNDDQDPALPAKRRYFKAETKRSILDEYEAATDPGAKGALLRRAGIYSSHISEWKRARDAGSLAALGGNLRAKRDSNRSETERLQRENVRLKRELEKTKGALEIMGKLHALLEDLSESAHRDNESPS
jgi:transposase